MYASLQGPLDPAAAGGQSVTTTAAAAFLHSLDSVYGQSQGSATQPPSGASTLGVQQFAEQAHFVGLVAAVLSAVQVRLCAGPNRSPPAPHPSSLLPSHSQMLAQMH